MSDHVETNTTNGNERFLSPVTQLVAIETDIAKKQRDLPRIVRDQHINDIYLRYYQQLQERLNKSTSGMMFLSALPSIKDQLKLDLKNEVERSVYNNFTMDNMKAQSKYLEKTYFIATPLLPSKPTPGHTLSALTGLLAGLMLGAVFVLIRYFYTKPAEMKNIQSQAQ